MIVESKQSNLWVGGWRRVRVGLHHGLLLDHNGLLLVVGRWRRVYVARHVHARLLHLRNLLSHHWLLLHSGLLAVHHGLTHTRRLVLLLLGVVVVAFLA